jgi:hypothetical protein
VAAVAVRAVRGGGVVSAWTAVYAGARLPRPCRCARGTCRRCLVRLGLVPPSARDLARAEAAQRKLDRAIERAAVEPSTDDEREQRAADTQEALAQLERMAINGVLPTLK